jgi:hypothetical protein
MVLVVGFTTTCAISAYHQKSCEFESRSWKGVLDITLCDKVCEWLATIHFLQVLLVSSTNKTETPQNNWNIVESGVKHHKPTEQTIILENTKLHMLFEISILSECLIPHKKFFQIIDLFDEMTSVWFVLKSLYLSEPKQIIPLWQ